MGLGQMPSKEIYFSIDIETDGQAPGLSSILPLGCAAFLPTSDEPIGTWQRNYTPLPDAESDAETLLWWRGFPDVWSQLQKDRILPALATAEFAEWIKTIAGDNKAIAAAWPASWDWAFVYYYFRRFNVRSTFGHSALDIKTLWVAYTIRKWGRSWASGRTYKADVPQEWKGASQHTHIGVDDAVEQGKILIHLLRELRNDKT